MTTVRFLTRELLGSSGYPSPVSAWLFRVLFFFWLVQRQSKRKPTLVGICLFCDTHTHTLAMNFNRYPPSKVMDINRLNHKVPKQNVMSISSRACLFLRVPRFCGFKRTPEGTLLWGAPIKEQRGT